MIDPNLLRCNLELIATKLFRRQCVLDIDLLRDQEVKRKCLQVRMQSLRSRSNLISKDIGVFKSRGDNVDSLFQEVNNLSKELQLTENDFKKLHNDITNYLLTLPNIPDDNIPDGCNSKDNLELLRWGTPRVYDFAIKDHVELGKVIGGLDFSIAAQITGSRFVVMKGVIAKLHRALSQFMLDLHIQEHGYQEYYVPYLVNKRALYGTGQLPKFVEDLFYVNFSNKENCSYALIPTAEVPLTNLVRNNILDEDVLPLKMTSCTPCFRSEVGNYGRDTRGLIRMHQFDKIEMVQIVKPEESMHILEEMTGHAEKVLQLLKLPYRKVLLCAGDLSFSACKTYDLEVWLPARNMYCEVSSCSNIGDFQSRRMYARYRSKKGNKIRFLHTINGSGLAVGRTLMAVLENYQLSNGQIEIPLVLRTYMNGVTSTGEE